jgi:alginate O-acetyltransferase complex protein AlgI
MLFNSYSFILLFAPITFAGYFLLGTKHRWLAMLWLAMASLFFYGWWNVSDLIIIGVSIVSNYIVGRLLDRARGGRARYGKLLLGASVAVNLGAIAYYKYFGFLISIVNDIFGSSLSHPSIALPLGISFFTFTQIAFLVDCHRGIATEVSFLRYLLFVSYFPHLIAGPILHHKEMLPQFGVTENYRVNVDRVLVGLALFSCGLFKKVGLADTVAPLANSVFGEAASGAALGTIDAWAGTIAYTLQIYFDFSGYSDMAVGLAQIMNIAIPLNFNSPYKSRNIIEFWRRWHMSLSRFLRDYLYIPLGGNRRGSVHRYVNLAVTMLLGGMWHGAGWTFVVWGGLHGVYLMLNHGWIALVGRRPILKDVCYPGLGSAITFLAVTIAWVFFRADSLTSAGHILAAMFDPQALRTRTVASSFLLLEVALLVVVWLAPNSQQLLGSHLKVCEVDQPLIDKDPSPWRWQPTLPWLVATGGIFGVAFTALSRSGEFIYFNF